MAQLNCPGCYQGGWVDCGMCDQQTGSNLSLSMAPSSSYTMNPMWMSTWHGPPPSMYPYPMHMHHHSRPPSPTQSIKSRKSSMSKKSRNKKYRNSEDTDEDDLEDRRSIFSHNERSDRKSANGRSRGRETNSMPREMIRRNISDRASRSRINIRDSSTPTDDEQSLSQKDEIADIEDVELNLTAEIPIGSWECEHCTFVNEGGTRVCSVCCKTPTSHVKILSNQNLTLLDKNRSSDDYSKDYSETESVLNKLGKLKTSDTSLKQEPMKKGRSRKISFWPGTKFSITTTK